MKRIVRNRKIEADLDEILSAFRTLSGAGHPDDYIDGDTAKIELKRPRGGKPYVVISWSGMPEDDPEYGPGRFDRMLQHAVNE